MFSTLFRLRGWLTTGFLVVSAAVTAYALRPTSVPTPPPLSNPPAMTPPLTVLQSTPPADEINPAVPPGMVRWHPSFAHAQTAAQSSGKPVLLFHMLGQLDRQFC
jgi:hypothetical protein